MNHSTISLFHKLLKSRGVLFSISDLARNMSVSERTIRNYAYTISRYIEKHDLPVEFKVTNSGIILNGSEQAASEVENILRNIDFYEYTLNASERQDIIKTLLMANTYEITIKQLESLLFVGHSTLVTDIKCIENEFAKKGIRIVRGKHEGIKAIAGESVRRDILIQIINEVSCAEGSSDIRSSTDIRLNSIKVFLKIDKYYTVAMQVMREAERIFQIDINDYDFYNLVTILCIIKFRIDSGQICDADKGAEGVQGINLDIAEYIIRILSNDDVLREEEVRYLAKWIQRKRIYSTSAFEKNSDINLYIIVKSFLYNLSVEYNFNLIGDTILQEYLKGHLYGLYHRIENKQKLNNPFKSQIIEQYHDDYLTIRKYARILEDGLGITMDDDEISYIVMHIVAALDRLTGDTFVPSVVIACNAGMGTANFLAQRIRKNLNVKIVAISSTHNLDALLNRQHCDMILTTVPLEDIDIPWVHVQPLLTSEDIAKVNDKITELSISHERARRSVEGIALFEGPARQDEELPNGSVYFSDLLTPGHILINREVVDWKEAVIAAGEPMLWDNAITPHYLSSMVTNIIKYGPYIVFAPGVAIAHAGINDGVINLAGSLVILKNPVEFGHKENDPVRIVAAVAVKENTDSINTIFSIMNTLCNSVAVNKLLKAKSEEEILEIIRYYENRVQ